MTTNNLPTGRYTTYRSVYYLLVGILIAALCCDALAQGDYYAQRRSTSAVGTDLIGVQTNSAGLAGQRFFTTMTLDNFLLTLQGLDGWEAGEVTTVQFNTASNLLSGRITNNEGGTNGLNTGLNGLIGRAITNAGNSWIIRVDSSSNYVANNYSTAVVLGSNDFSGLLQNVVNRAGDGAYIHIAASPYYTAGYTASNTVTLTNWCVIAGDGNPATVIRAADTLDAPIIQLGSIGDAISGINRFRNIRFEGGDGGTACVGVKAVNSAEPVFENCEFTQFKFAGIQLSQTNANHWSYAQNCWFVMLNGGTGILIDREPVTGSSQDFYVHDCMFGIGDGKGIVVSNRFRNVSIQGNRFRWFSPFDSGVLGVQLYAGENYTIANNQFPDWPATTSPIRFEDRSAVTNYNSLVTGNYASRVGSTTATNVVYVGTNVQGVALANNRATDGTGYVLAGTNGTAFILDYTKSFLGGVNMPGATASTFAVFDGSRDISSGIPTNSFTTHAQVATASNTVYSAETTRNAAVSNALAALLVINDNITSNALYSLISAGGTAWDAIGDPTGAGTIAFGANLQDITSTADDAVKPYVLQIVNTDADQANDISILQLGHNDTADANVTYARFQADASGAPVDDYIFGQTAFSVGSAVATTLSGAATLNGTATFNGPIIDTPGSATLTGTNRWLNGALGNQFTNTFTYHLNSGVTNVLLENIGDGQTITFYVFAEPGVTVGLPQFTAAQYAGGRIAAIATNALSVVKFFRSGVSTNVTVETQDLLFGVSSDFVMSTNPATSTATLDLATGSLSNLVASGINFPVNVVSNVGQIKFNLQQPVITVSNLVISPNTNRWLLRGLTNVVFTNLVEESGTSGDIAIYVENTTGVTMGLVWPAYGSQHGYHFKTNANNPVLSATSLASGASGVASFTWVDTNWIGTWITLP